MKSSIVCSIYNMLQEISSFDPFLPHDMSGEAADEDRGRDHRNRGAESFIPEHAPLEYICLLYRL